MGKNTKTNVMRLLEQQNIPYKAHYYKAQDAKNGIEVAFKTGNNPDQQFKTLVTVSNTNQHYVFVVPVSEELDLKKSARAVKEKNISMIKEKELLPLTGYVRGGCSPIGMKKQFETVFHRTAEAYETVIISAGKGGASVEINPFSLNCFFPVRFEDLTENK